MTHNAIVLGCGLVGATMAKDLAGDPEFAVTVADVSADNLAKLAGSPAIRTVHTDASDPAKLRALVVPFDVVLGALPSRFGFATLRTVIEAGKNYADISFMPEDALELDVLAKQRGVACVVDCGVAPGISNLMVGHVYRQLEKTTRADICVGGLPKERRWPYQYKAPFAPSDVIEEYTRTARFVVNGQIVEKPALTDAEPVDFDRVGTLESFNTDGLRSLLKTVKIPHMIEKTLRYPGHCELMRVLRETGFFNQAEVEVRGAKVRPIDLTAKLLFPKWTYAEGEEEFTVMRIVVEGEAGGHRVRHTYELYDEYDRKTRASSMSRTTAFPCAIVARMLARGQISQRGVLPPELLAENEAVVERILHELAARGVHLSHCVESPR